MLNVTAGTYQDPCGQCNALCCRVYEIKKPAKSFTFRGIPIKEQNISCTHLDGNQCCIYDSRDSFGFSVCSEFSCFSVGPIVLDWARKRGLNINYAINNEGNGSSSYTDHQLIATCLNQARDYVADLLGVDAPVEPLNNS